MGRSKTSKYAVRVDGRTASCWFVKENGAPTVANLTKYVRAYIDSLKSTGCNAHISKALGFMPIPNWAEIVLNGTDTVVARWTAPAFMTI